MDTMCKKIERYFTDTAYKKKKEYSIVRDKNQNIYTNTLVCRSKRKREK